MAAKGEKTFYVALTGNDESSGRRADPNADGTDGPFATLTRARDAVRAARDAEGRRTAPVGVMIRGGTHSLREPLRLGAEDGGTRENPVTWCAYPGETPVLSGGTTIDGWEPYEGSILRAVMPDAGEGRWKTRQLFYKGQRLRRARWPKVDPDNLRHGGWAFVEGAVPGSERRAFCFRSGTFPRRWAKPQEGEVNLWVQHGWCNNILPIESIDYDQRILRVTREPFQADLPPWFMEVLFSSENRFFVENILGELTEPGEWCFDSGEGVFYFWPPDGPPEEGAEDQDHGGEEAKVSGVEAGTESATMFDIGTRRC